MSTRAIEISKQTGLQEWKTPAQIKARINAIQQLMDETLKQDVDFGVIPGMPKGTKPSLWKPGSEQILAMFQIAVEPIVEDLSTDDCYRYRVTARLTNSLTGEFLGAGIGECSSDETKYKWRRTYVKKEFENTPDDRRRTKYGQRKDGGNWVDYEEMQVRQEPADLANTILKMAKKRAQIDATLTVTGASSMFEQDLEDLSDETRDEMSRQRKPKEQKKSPDKATGDVMCNECRAVNGHLPSCKFRQQQSPKGQQAQQEDKKKTEAQKWLVQVQAVDARERVVGKDKEGKDVKKQFQLLSCINAAGEDITLYSWHTGETWKRLEKMAPKARCVFMVKASAQGDKTYYSVDSIVEISGEVKDAETEDFTPVE